MNAWSRYWHGYVHPARSYLVMKVVLLLVGYDTFVEMISHGGRYGVGDFNVAHFWILDLILPTPTPAIYIGAMVFSGLLALTMVVTRPHRVGLALLWLTYTYSWAMSMLDSYQHHYLISLVLFCLIFFPVRNAREARDVAASPNGAATSSAGYMMLGFTCALVYGFTVLTKLTGRWYDGHALGNIARCREGDDGAMRCGSKLVDAVVHGADDPLGQLAMLAAGAIVIQAVSSVGYSLASIQDRARRWKNARMVALVALSLAPIQFHIGAEFLDLRIGWFSYYMLALALVFFWPAPVWGAIVRVIARVQDSIDGLIGADERTELVFKAVILAATLALTIGLAHYVDLPGVVGAASLFAAAAAIAYAAYAKGTGGLFVRTLVLGALFAGTSMWFTLTLNYESANVRFDYYRFIGGDARRRGEWETALGYYRKANAYAPRDCDALHDEDLPRRQRRCDRQREEDEAQSKVREMRMR